MTLVPVTWHQQNPAQTDAWVPITVPLHQCFPHCTRLHTLKERPTRCMPGRLYSLPTQPQSMQPTEPSPVCRMGQRRNGCATANGLFSGTTRVKGWEGAVPARHTEPNAADPRACSTQDAPLRKQHRRNQPTGMRLRGGVCCRQLAPAATQSHNPCASGRSHPSMSCYEEAAHSPNQTTPR